MNEAKHNKDANYKSYVTKHPCLNNGTLSLFKQENICLALMIVATQLPPA